VETSLPTLTPVPPSDTPEPTDTPPPPTNTPAPTATQTQTSTPLPPPDPKAMIAWKELGLPSEYEAFPPEARGIQEGENAYAFSVGGEYKEYNISGSFLFANGDIPDTSIYGYTIMLPTDEDLEIYDQIIDEAENIGEFDLTVLEDSEDIGDHSKGATGEYGGEHFTSINFRVGNVGAVVFLRHDLANEPGIDAKDVAKVYAKSIEQPTSYCRITSINVVPDANIPTFEVEAEGFYPQEGRYLKLEGAIDLNGETIKVGTIKAGTTGETVEADGSLSEEISIAVMDQLAAQGYQNTEPIEGPIEFTVTVGGYQSLCEATQTVIWP
jgi:hypothetical protein